MSVETTIPPWVGFRGSAAAAAFDRIAEDYDQRFTYTLISRAQRDAVWRVLAQTWKKDDRVLELNCGTGEDAVFLASNGISVLACDASRQMIVKAQQRLQQHPDRLPVFFCRLSAGVDELAPETRLMVRLELLRIEPHRRNLCFPVTSSLVWRGRMASSSCASRPILSQSKPCIFSLADNWAKR